MTITASIRPPAKLGARGKRLWKAVLEDFEPDVQERELLIEVCRCLDRCEALEKALRDEPLTTKGSRGQPVAHPLLAELRSERTLLSRLLSQIAPEPEEGTGAGKSWEGLTSSQRARRAAAARWGHGGTY